ncbi:DEAD/DEAH box helicase [Aureibacter tunicatorum]|uniref:ATP-dependent RNA helicase DeaD n=1 Tax=Aureibacter tunicatorum TaxID=866807 RepID=A0AAE4BUQ6_9BACT|nr:DEAD/DEAH box helicase [Aureibacter tunicatorum]MDR6241047.1 ATP-dependent RNA helicase DeaD [Aureibacter tunicatorum]BDD03825.1 DEAD/DEAH box helicase [Aureibacter tunicatorum]
MKSFSSSQLNKKIVDNLHHKGITIPSKMQAQTIPLLLKHEGDFVGQSATGTGKTYAFGAPLLSLIDNSTGKTQGIVLVPTRELCEQVGNELSFLAEGIEGLKVNAIYGGMSLKSQAKEISNGTQVLVATPGRMVDLIERKVIDLSTVKYVVFDEADEMLLKGYQTDIDKILSTANRHYSTWLFSATMPVEIKGLIKKYLNKELIQVRAESEEKQNQMIEHRYMLVSPEEKSGALINSLSEWSDKKGIIFCRTKSGVQKLYKQLSAKKISCGAIHGDLPQGLRNKVMDQYREGNISILIATDVASRGVDIPDVSFVIQYHIPDTSEAYTHRSGRTSRIGNAGICLSFAFEEEKIKLLEIFDTLNIKAHQVEVPSAKDQLVSKAMIWAKKVSKEKPIGNKLDAITKNEFKNILSHLSKDELLEKLLATYLREEQDR